jgi:hypothetical protein
MYDCFRAAEVLADATLTVYYTFDNSSLADSGSLHINATGAHYSYSSSGRVSLCLALINTPSYIQASALVLLGTPGQSYSFSIWIKPTVITNGTIIHVSSLASGLGWCFPALGFTSGGAIGVQGWNGSAVSLTGPTATPNVWTHLAITYSSSNGISFWVSGTQYGSASGPYNYSTPNSPVIVTIGSSLSGASSCPSTSIVMGQYHGYIDQFQLYSRELSASDITSLANP